MSQINVSDLSFYYDGSYDPIFEHVSFQIDTDWKLGFVGRNGRGKTTFLKLLMGEYEYRGSISASVSFDYFPFPVKEISRNTIDIIEEVQPDYELWRVMKEMTLLNVDADVLYRPFETLSHGERTKILLSVLFSRDNHFLLIDEPTNHLDMETREMVMDYLNHKKGFILVSHDRWFLDGCTDHTLSINKTDIEIVRGNFSVWWENKKRRDAFELAENEKLKKEVGRLKKAARQSGKWADDVEASKIGRKSFQYERNIDTRAYVGEKSRRMQMRRKNLEHRQNKAIEEKEQLLKNIESEEELKIMTLPHHKNRLVTLEDVGINYGGRQVVEHLGMTVDQGERIVLNGRNGCGKSSVIRLLLGENVPHTGKVELASGMVISYISQDTGWLKGDLRSFARDHQLAESLFLTILRKLDFAREQFDKPIEDYSEGQKKKVLIAKSLSEQANLYIWDEPLNFIDLFSRMQIEELILRYKPTLLMVEHDRSFVENVATHVVRL